MEQENNETQRPVKAARGLAVNWLGRKLHLLSHNEGLSSPPSQPITTPNAYPDTKNIIGNIQSPLMIDRLRFEAGMIRHHHKRGVLPLSVSCVEVLGNVCSENTYVKRDLGFQGQIGNNILLTYGDTLFSDRNYSDTWRGMTSDSVALATHNPLEVLDVYLDNQSYPQQFCPILSDCGEDSSTYALGITNVVETYPGQGILYFLLNHRPGGVNNIVGAGVATISMSNTYPPVPSIQRLGQFWWDGATEPWFGDVGAIRAGNYIYTYGHANDTPYVYLARVLWQSVTDLSCYEYWNGETWQAERLYNVGEKEGVFWQINQGQVIWSEYYQCFLFVYCDRWMNSKVLAKTAPAPEGPWSDAVTLYQATPIKAMSSIYAAVPHPYFDLSGKNLIITFTNDPNTIQAINLTFG